MHTKIQGHRLFGSGEEDFFRFLPYMRMAAILVMWPGPFEQPFVPPPHRSAIWSLTLIGPMVSEEKMLKACGRRTTEAYLSYKLTKWAFGSGELKCRSPYDKMPNLVFFAICNSFSALLIGLINVQIVYFSADSLFYIIIWSINKRLFIGSEALSAQSIFCHID